jgi:hypothetical protein
MISIFNGKLAKSFETNEFLTAGSQEVLKLKHLILYSARLAFHISIDKFIMADLDTPDWKELEELIRKEDGAWFLGGEDFLWNEAI